MERSFAQTYASTGDQKHAQAMSGFSQQGASAAVNRPVVQAEIQKLTIERIESEVLPLAVGRHIALLKDEKCTGQVLNRAIEMAYKYGLSLSSGQQKQPHEMTASELAQAIAALERAASDKARPVEDIPPAGNVFA